MAVPTYSYNIDMSAVVAKESWSTHAMSLTWVQGADLLLVRWFFWNGEWHLVKFPTKADIYMRVEWLQNLVFVKTELKRLVYVWKEVTL